tara:strand:+ start:1069 stop:1239 length:171 start_codon:yes stop_codon:yes gene_type:complete
MADKELKTTWVDNNIVVTGSDEATNKLIAELIAKKLAEGKTKPGSKEIILNENTTN